VARQEWPGLDDSPGRPSRNSITEADLVRGYSGVGAGRRLWPEVPVVNVETVRADYEATVEADDAERPDSREEVRP
jgi:hypothetical protein